MYKELNNAIKKNAKKSDIRKIKMKLKMNNLPPIQEHPDESITIDDEDLDKLIDLDEEIKNYEAELKDEQEKDPIINQMKQEALNTIENELQQRRKEYLQEKTRSYNLKFAQESGITDIAKMTGVKANKEVYSMFAQTTERKDEDQMTDQEKSNAAVPEDLKKWIFRPEIAVKFANPPTRR